MMPRDNAAGAYVAPEDETYTDDEVIGDDREVAAVPVRVINPLRVNELPGRIASMKTTTVVLDAQPVKILGADSARKSVTLFVSDDNVILSTSPGEAGMGVGALIPGIGFPFTLAHAGELWAATTTVGGAIGNAKIGVIVEMWA
jgi:hypothetical protein